MRRVLVLAFLIYCIILFRAAHQAVTLDEADSFNNFANENVFYPSSGNHVLNSLLARQATAWYGISQFTIRLPAMLGAALYLLAAASITARLAPKRKHLGFALLTLNPFVLDYLVAARGYSLALGLLACAVALALKMLEERTSMLYCTIFSLCLALALTANFAFAFAILSTAGAFLLTLLLMAGPLREWISIAAATTLPGSAAGYLLLAETLRNYPLEQLYYGAHTWTELWSEMLDAAFPKQNLSLLPSINFEPLLSAAHAAAAVLILIPIGVALWTVLVNKSWPIRFIALSLAGTLAAHALAHSLQGLLLPLDRTSLFILFFLSVLVIQGDAANPLVQRASSGVLWGALAIFMLAFRSNYFRIWDFDLDTDRGFAALAQYNGQPLRSAGCTWRYDGAYNFYHIATHQEKLPKCDFVNQENPEPRDVYFLMTPFQDEFIQKAQLQVIYRGPISGLVVGVRPPHEKEVSK